MNLSKDIWTDDNKLRAAFSWLTRIGAAPKFGSLPIAYYHQDQVKAIDALKKCASAFGLELREIKLEGQRFRVRESMPGKRGRWHTVAFFVLGKIIPAKLGAN